MSYDLNVPWSTNSAELKRTLAFLAEYYNVVALNYIVVGKLPADLTSPIPKDLPFETPPQLKIIRRCTLVLEDPQQNHRLALLAANYDVLALRPVTEKALLHACQFMECDLISLDMSIRYPFHFKLKTFTPAIQRGIKVEICYAAGTLNADSGLARRNLISNATSLIRATRGRGIVLSSEAKQALACRGPADVVNLAAMWGLGQEKGREAVGREARAVIVQAEMKRRSFRGVVDVVYGGEKPEKAVQEIAKPSVAAGDKRKASAMSSETGQVPSEDHPISKREQKRRAKMAKLEKADGA